MSDKKKTVSIIITSMNEYDTIDEFISRIRASFENTPYLYEIIFIDDRSTDGSLNKLIKYAQDDSKITTISMSRNFGRHACFFAGFEYATGDFGATMDSDLQDPPELLPKMLMKLEEESADLVYSVMIKRLGESKIKLILTRLSYWLLEKICYIEMPRNAGYLKVFNKKVIDEIRRTKEVDSYFKGLYNYIGLKQIPFPYLRDPRAGGKTQYSLLGYRPYRDLLKAITSFSYLPLYIPIFVSIALLMFGATAFLYSLYTTGIKRFCHQLFNSPLAIYITLLAGCIIMILSIISLYLIQIHASTRGRQRYIIDKIYKRDDNE